jgi:transcriptional antiterminator NusG
MADENFSDNRQPEVLQDALEVDRGVAEDEIHPETGVPERSVEEGAEIAGHAPAPEEPTGPPKNWYIIHAYSGFEQKVADSLRTRAQAYGFAGRIGQILIPTEEVIELRSGKKVTSKRLLYPGYVLVEMEMDDELWHAVKATPRVTGFVGGGTKPVPLTADEVNSVLYRQASSQERPRPKMKFEKGETVKIIDGPFTNFSGRVDEVNTDRNTLRVMVTIFGRSTPVELDFLQVEKI